MFNSYKKVAISLKNITQMIYLAQHLAIIINARIAGTLKQKQWFVWCKTEFLTIRIGIRKQKSFFDIGSGTSARPGKKNVIRLSRETTRSLPSSNWEG